MKVCRTCHAEKDLDCFYASPGCKGGRRPVCIVCLNTARKAAYATPEAKAKHRADYIVHADHHRAKSREWRDANLERAKEKSREWSRENAEKHRAMKAKWREENKERILQYSRDYHTANRDTVLAKAAKKRRDNPDHFKARDLAYGQANPDMRKRIDKKRRSSPKGRLEHTIRSGVSRGIVNGSKAGRRTFGLLGYSPEVLKAHLERQFADGMSWDNYGAWHIDHIIPLSAHNYSTPDCPDFKRAWALTNLQPLWAQENLRKNAKLTRPFQPSLQLREA